MENLFQTILPGVSQMTNVHPLLVHFPIALLNAFFVMEFFGFLFRREELRVAADWMLYLGTLGAIGAVSAGLWAASTVPHSDEVHAIMLRHRNLGLAVLASGVMLSVWRLISHSKFSRNGQIVHLILAFITIIVMALGADLGGLMVYKYGVAVKAVPHPTGHIHGGNSHKSEEDQIEADHHNNKDHAHEMDRGN